jgi:putative ABC transport system substrate-binding protein
MILSRHTRRREFITALGGAAAWPLAARAQQVPRIGVLMSGDESDDIGQARVKTFQDNLARLGWNNGRNVQIDIRWGGVETQLRAQLATEIVSLRPDVLFAGGTPELIALRPARSIPTVFANVADPIGGGFVASLGRPGGNITGFMSVEPPIASKWLQLLKGIVPGLTRVSLLFNPEVDSYAGEFFRHAETAAVPLSVELIAAPVHDEIDVAGVLAALGRDPNSGIMVMPESFMRIHRVRIAALAAEHRLPAIWSGREYAAAGALISYGVDQTDLYRQATSYIDRILRGGKPADLPVQAPTRFELIINLRTARALGLNVSADMRSIADEIIE